MTDAVGVTRVARRRGRQDYAIAAVSVGVLALLFMLWDKPLLHWYVLPVTVCGILSGVDIVRWLRGRVDFFDPKTLIACLTFYGFFLAPLMHVLWNTFGLGDLILYGDWRPWLGAMACLNALGLLVYRSTHNFTFDRTRPSTTWWEIDHKRFYPVFAFALASSIAGVTAFLWQLGGIAGMIEAYDRNQEAFAGKGWLLVLAWPLAVLSFIVIVFAWADRHRKTRHRLMTAVLLLSLAGAGHFLLLGWYGSRSATIWAMFWMAGIIHYRFRKLSPQWVAVGVTLLIAFMYFYGFYKERGRSSLDVLRSPAMWINPKGYERRDVKSLLLEDLARADADAYVLHNLVKDPGDYDYRWGLTYAGGLAILIPRYFWPDRPEVKIEAGTEAQLGKATPWRSLRVYGLSGEALLNFGPLGVVPMFAAYGALLGWYRRKLWGWDWSDARMLLAPFLAILFATGLAGDSDNLVFAAVTEGTLIFTAIFLSSKRLPAKMA